MHQSLKPKTYTTMRMVQAVTHISCMLPYMVFMVNEYRTTSGGFNNVGRVVEYRQAFKDSLRQYERPFSSYVKLGGMACGMQRTASSNTFKPRNE